jgi:hypothetical protein
MADSKISALPASTTPLAGTEVLPIVQSSTTKQVSVANLTAGRAISASTVTATTTIGVGAATPSTSGAGITFPATQSASSDANTLDDYEEGTWTPSIGGTATYNAQAGTYTKIGNVVTVAFDIYILLKGTGSATTVSGLPFTTANTTPYNENGSGVAYFSAIATSVTYLTAVLNKNATTLHFDGLSAAAATMPSTINVFQNSTDVYCTITYLI